MNALERGRKLFESTGLPMLEKYFAEELPEIAIGIAGRGSECFGFDDEISLDHDFEEGFTLWISDKLDEKSGFRLTRAYREAAKSFPQIQSKKSFGGTSERGVMRISDFFRRHLGYPGAPETWQQWLYTPEYAFAEVTNGEIFRDDSGKFSGIREKILRDMPEDVRYKKIAACAVLMAQNGQYNFSRCLRHGEKGAAMLALSDFVRYTISMFFLLNERFAPYWKWSLRAMKSLPVCGETAEELTDLLCTPMSDGARIGMIEKICGKTAGILTAKGWCSTTDEYLENHALEITDRIRSREIRSLHLMDGV